MSIFSQILSGIKTTAINLKNKSLSLQKKSDIVVKEDYNLPNTPTPAVTPKKKDNKTILLEHAKKEGITNKNELAMLLAQLHHESRGFTKLVEDLNYKPETLLKVFPTRFKTLVDAQSTVSKGQQTIAARLYDGRMGNVNPGDGWKYRGRGFIHLTGKENYIEQQGLTKLPLVSNPDLLLDPTNAAIASVSYWKNTKGLRSAAQSGDVVRASAIINTGNANSAPNKINGLADRKNLYTKYLKEV